jgi:hypothetical protein
MPSANPMRYSATRSRQSIADPRLRHAGGIILPGLSYYRKPRPMTFLGGGGARSFCGKDARIEVYFGVPSRGKRSNAIERLLMPCVCRFVKATKVDGGVNLSPSPAYEPTQDPFPLCPRCRFVRPPGRCGRRCVLRLASRRDWRSRDRRGRRRRGRPGGERQAPRLVVFADGLVASVPLPCRCQLG